MNKEEPSLLSHFNEIRKSNLPEGGISTIIICGQMKSDAVSDKVLSLHRDIVEAEVNSEEVNVTGLLMGQGNCFLHLLEGPCDSLLRILTKLADSDHFIKDDVQNGRIVYNVEDRSKRYFPEWYSCIIGERNAQIEEITEDNCIDIVHELAVKLLEVGIALQTELEGEVELNEYSDYLPSKDLVIALSNSALFFSVQDFVKIFAGPFHVTLESETSWPLESLVQY